MKAHMYMLRKTLYIQNSSDSFGLKTRGPHGSVANLSPEIFLKQLDNVNFFRYLRFRRVLPLMHINAFLDDVTSLMNTNSIFTRGYTVYQCTLDIAIS